MTEPTTEPDIFASIDLDNPCDLGQFIPYDRDKLPLLRQLTQLDAQLRQSLSRLKPARSRLGQLKGQLLDEAFARKYPDPQPESERFQLTERSMDWNKAYFRRSPYQNAHVALSLAIAALAEDAANLQICIIANIDELGRMADPLERDVLMLNVQLAEHLLFAAEAEHKQAVQHLAAQPNSRCGLLMVPQADAIKRLRNDSDTQYWTKLRR